MLPNHDEWIIGEGLEADSGPSRWYVIHTRAPEFRVEILDEADVDESCGRSPILEGGLSVALPGGQTACNLVWYGDTEPTEADLRHWILGRVAEVLADYDERSERRLMREQQADDDEFGDW